MTQGIKASITRIRGVDGRVAGAGFLVGDRLVLTCAHVVNLALGRPAQAAERPSDDLVVDFPLLAGPTVVGSAGVLRWLPVSATGDGDVALLLLLPGDPPVGAAPAVLVQADEPWGHRFRVCGFPAGYDGGDWASGRLLEAQATRWLQVEDDKPTGHWVQPGYSGAPVWDEQLSGIVGMAVAADRHPDAKVAYVLPTAVLVEACPELAERRTLPCPYRGLASFREQDAALFFGREVSVARLMDAVRRLELVALVGASGSGKSSLIFAGLLPALASEDHVVAVFRPGKDPFQAVAAALLPILDPALSRADVLLETPKLAEVVRQGRLDEVLAQVAVAADGRRVLLLGDQFEELFTLCPDAEMRRLFLDTLLGAVAVPWARSATVVLTLRADFHAQALAHRGLADALQAGSVLLGPMTREELRQAIEAPARARDVTFEAGLVDRILADVAEEPGCLPLLEFTLTLLWERQSARRLTHQAYEGLGGVEGALSSYADQVLDVLDEAERERARRVFVQLVKPGETTEDTRRLAARTELDPADWALVQRLADERLIVTDSDPAGRETAEVIHEALIKAWPTLRSWMDEDREFRTWQERVRDAMEVWESSGNDRGDRDPELLLRGSALEQARRWLTDRPEELHNALVEFIHLSEQTQRQRLDRDRRRVRLLGILLVLAVGLTAFAALQVNRARQQTRLALSRFLAAQALSDVTTDLPRSLLLSVEALHLKDTTEARGALLTGLQSSPNLLTYLPSDAGTLFSAAFSPDGATLAAGSENGSVLLWDSRSHQPRGQPLTGHRDWVNSVAFSPDGRLLASGSDDNSIIVWDVRSHRRLGEPLLARGPVTSVAFSPDGSTLASGSKDHTVRLWEVRTRRPLGPPLIAHTGAVNAVAFSPDGSTLASAGDDARIILWDVRRHQRRGQPLVGHDKAVTSVAFSPRGAILASAGEDHTVRLWDVATHRPLGMPLRGHQLPVWSVAFSPDGSTLASGAGDNSVRLWDVRGHRPLGDALTGHSSFVLGVAFSPDGRTLASASDDHNVGLWNVRVREPLGARLVGTGSAVYGVAVSPDGTIVASGGASGVSLWDTDTGSHRRLRDARIAGNGRVWSVAFSPDGTTVAAGNEDGTINLWNVRSGRLSASLLGHHGSVESVAFSPDGRTLASGSDDRTVMLWDLRRGDRSQLTGHTDTVNAVAFSPDGRLLASASDDNTAILWDVRTRRPTEDRISGSRAWRAVAFSPDRATLALGSAANTMTLWDYRAPARRRAAQRAYRLHR